MKRVYKYPLSTQDFTEVNLPVGAELLYVNEQYGKFYLWAMVDVGEEVEKRRIIRIAGTGHDISQNVRYINSFYVIGGALVFHAFEVV